jgi:ketosteroid isomerase-like protein
MRIVMLLAMGIGVFLVADTDAGSADDESVFVPHYLDALAAATHGQSTEDDIDAVLDYYTENIVYEHPRFGVRLEGKEAQRLGMVSFLDSYAGGPSDSAIEIIDFMKGDQVVAVRIAVSFLQDREGVVERASRNQLRILEISSGKISRIIDYW